MLIHELDRAKKRPKISTYGSWVNFCSLLAALTRAAVQFFANSFAILLTNPVELGMRVAIDLLELYSNSYTTVTAL